MDRFWNKVEKTDTCWNWVGSRNEKGYGGIRVGGVLYKAHRYSWFLEHGYFPEKDLCHTCDNPSCVRVEHLFEGSRKENMEDCVSKGRQTSGEKNSKSVLTDEEVLEIRAASGKQKDIAKQFGVSNATVCMILNRKTWRHI